VEIIEAEMEMSFPSLLYSLDLYSLKADEIYPLNCSFSCKSIGSGATSLTLVSEECLRRLTSSLRDRAWAIYLL